MATSGSFNTAAFTTEGKTRYLTFSWERTSYSVEDNTSTISYTLKGNGTYTGYIMTRNITLVINGTTVFTTKTDPIKVYVGTLIKSGTITISHNSDGAKSFSASAEAGIYNYAVNCKGSSSWALNTIPRKSTITATDGNIGSTTTITITRASSSFTHTLKWSCLGLSGTLATKTTETSFKLTIPTSIYQKIPNDKTATVTVTCETFNNGTSLGTNTCTFTATASENECKPDLSFASILDVNEKSKAVTKNNKTFVKGVSNAQVSGVDASGKNSAKIKSIEFKCDNLSATVSNGTATITSVTSGTFSVIATDSRGYSTTLPYTATLYDYYKPTMTINVARTESTSNFVKVDYSGSFCNNITATGLSLDFCYVKDDGNYSEWFNIAKINSNGTTTITQGSFTTNGNTFSGSATLDKELDYRKEGVLQFRLVDWQNTSTYNRTVIPGIPAFDWGESSFNVNVPIHYQNNPMDFIVEQGTQDATGGLTGGNYETPKITWHYRMWYSGISECWGEFEINSIDFPMPWYGTDYQGNFGDYSHVPLWQSHGWYLYIPYGTPRLFVERPVFTITIRGSGTTSGVMPEGWGDGDYYWTPYVCVVRPNTTTVDTVITSYYVRGRWK